MGRLSCIILWMLKTITMVFISGRQEELRWRRLCDNGAGIGVMSQESRDLQPYILEEARNRFSLETLEGKSFPKTFILVP